MNKKPNATVLSLLGLLCFLVAVEVLTDVASWRVIVGAWALYLGVQGAVAVVVLSLREK